MQVRFLPGLHSHLMLSFRVCQIVVLLLFSGEGSIIAGKELQNSIETGENLVVNGSFDNWNNSYPEGWIGRPLMPKVRKVPTFNNHGIKIANSEYGISYVSQTVATTPGKYYHLSTDLLFYYGELRNVGISVVAESKQIGFHHLEDYVYNAKRTLAVRFRAPGDKVEIRMGFRKLDDGEAIFDTVTLVEVPASSTKFESAFANYLVKKLGLNFGEVDFDDSVLKISEYVYSVMVAPKRELDFYTKKDSTWNDENLLGVLTKRRLKARDSLLQHFPNSSFYHYVSVPIEKEDNLYLQRAREVVLEVLAEFNVPGRMVRISYETDKVHPTFEYWNPHRASWAMVDFFYGVIFTTNLGPPLSLKEVQQRLNNGEQIEQLLKVASFKEAHITLDGLKLMENASEIKYSYKERRTTYAY